MNENPYDILCYNSDNGLDYPYNSLDVVLLNTKFNIDDIYNSNLIDLKHQKKIEKRILKTIKDIFYILKDGGFLFIYGIPKYLTFYGNILNRFRDKSGQLILKNWIALDILDQPRRNTLKSTHIGLIFSIKTKSPKNYSYKLNVKQVRIPYKKCNNCGKYIKDWGGKKERMNPLGARLSDVWKDLPKLDLKDHKIPHNILQRIYDLTKNNNFKFLHLIEVKDNFDIISKSKNLKLNPSNIEPNFYDIKNLYNRVFNNDCIEFLTKINKNYPSGIFNLIFADPPYNLEKNYSYYNDDLEDKEYLKWCEDWLFQCINALQPGGSLFILNIPKWAVHHAQFLMKYLEFRHWIVWDAMSKPNGTLIPAHYALLYFTKPKGKITFNYISKDKHIFLNPIDSNIYCLRGSCIKNRKMKGNDAKLPLTDIWWNIHRIRHKKDRDSHPCQLPNKLMNRIINLSTNEGDIIYDPFSGTGTSSICAKELNRRFVTTEIDKKYIEITKKNLKKKIEEIITI